MKRKVKVWLIGSNDVWDALYIDGKAVFQNHSISIHSFMEYLQGAGLAKDVDFSTGSVTGEGANEKLESMGAMPDEFSEIEDDVS